MKKSRSEIIVNSGYLFIAINFLLSVFNIMIGLLSNSIAIISDAIHSLIDAISGILVIVSEKLANRKKFSDKRAKIERIATIMIAIIIIATGIHIAIESFAKIITPEEVDYSAPIIIVLVASIITKYLLAAYLKKNGKKTKSDVLIASSAETMNDTFISIAVFISAIVYLIWRVDIEAYMGIIISIVIIKIGLEFIFPHISSHRHHHPFETDPTHGVTH
ncbi:cation diffusion facilitator family transporter [Candidatus Saccharibacteria bacterium]|nr:cation diffusion facilitator family transporter [Candidatus Saccharibacteria bacterium]